MEGVDLSTMTPGQIQDRVDGLGARLRRVGAIVRSLRVILGGNGIIGPQLRDIETAVGSEFMPPKSKKKMVSILRESSDIEEDSSE